MFNPKYKAQANLLLSVLPAISEEECFAIHGGTAINLFLREMPRLSVDIDLTYVPIQDRATTLKQCDSALLSIKEKIKHPLPRAQVSYKKEMAKLAVRNDGDEIKIEVNLVARGTIAPPTRMILCETAQLMFDRAPVIQVVPFGQIYGGKICAALDRQHPRDLFDSKYLMENEGFTDEVRAGFLLCLLSSDRPINEVLMPNFQDQRQAMNNQFAGMSNDAFPYDEYERTRVQLVKTVNHSLTASDKEFLLGFHNCQPDWYIYDFERFPAVRWKLLNLRKLKESNPEKHIRLYEALKKLLIG